MSGSMSSKDVKTCGGKSRAIIHVDCITHKYPDGTEGIHDMCFSVYPCEIVALCGPNGAGKSTLIEHLNGLLTPDIGRIQVFGTDIEKDGLESIRRMVGIVFQDADSQLFSPTVLEDVMFGPLNLGMTVDDAKERARWALDVVGVTDLEKIPHNLSGGQKRLVALAGILAMKPKILVADEPTGDLDPSNARRVERVLRSLRDEHGMSVVIALHDMNLAARLADRVCIVKNGSIMAKGAPREVLYNESLMESAGLEMPLVARIYRDLDLERVSPERPASVQELVQMLKSR